MFGDAGLFLRPTSLDWCRWGDRQPAVVRLEPVNQHRLLCGSYFQLEHLGTRVQHAYGPVYTGAKGEMVPPLLTYT